jgi:hypothetical protein
MCYIKTTQNVSVQQQHRLELKIEILKTEELSLPIFPPVICSGTQNALSVTGSSQTQYTLMKEMYSGCEIVMGNLEITMMEHWRDFTFLQVRG